MDWIIHPMTRESEIGGADGPYYVPLSEFVRSAADVKGAKAETVPDSAFLQKEEEQLRGMTGLIALGGAWESVDIFEALRKLLQRR